MTRPITNAFPQSLPVSTDPESSPSMPPACIASVESATVVERFARANAERSLASTGAFPFEGACLGPISALKPGEFLEVSLAADVKEGLTFASEGRARVERQADGSFTVEMLGALHGGVLHENQAPTTPGIHNEFEGSATLEVRGGTKLKFESAEAAADFCGAACEAGCHVSSMSMDPTSLAVSGFAFFKHVANGDNPLGMAAEQRTLHYLKSNAIEFTAALGGKLEGEAKIPFLQANVAAGAALESHVNLQTHTYEQSFGFEGEGRAALTGALIPILENQRGFGASGEWTVAAKLIRETELAPGEEMSVRQGRDSKLSGDAEYFVEVEAERTFDLTMFVAEYKATDSVKIKIPLSEFKAVHSQQQLAALIERSPTEISSERVKNANALTAGFDLHVAALEARMQKGSVTHFEGATLEAAVTEAAQHSSNEETLEGQRMMAAVGH